MSRLRIDQIASIMRGRYSKEMESQSPWSEQYENSTTKHRSNLNQCCLVNLISAYNEIFKCKEWMVPIGQANSKIDGKLVGETYIINGPAQSGKASLVYWALRNDNNQTAIVTVDCSLYRTDMQFIQKLTREIGEKIGASGLDKRTVANENIKFADLNGPIKEKGVPIVILIRSAERLVEFRKQILLYNLLEWILTDIKKMVGLVFTTRLIYFVDKFEKRVRSRLAAKQLVVHRPNPENILHLLARRVECLIEQEREEDSPNQSSLRVYEKILRCMCENKLLLDVIRDNQQFSQKDIVFYLNAMKLVFASFHSAEEILDMEERDLKESLCDKLKESFDFIFPFIPKNLLKTCSYPEYIIMAIIYHMAKHERTPYRFKTVYEIYLQFKQKLVTSEGTGSSFIYSKNVLERAVLKLEELNLIELESKEDSVWNCDIRCSLYPEDLKKTMNEINENDKLPNFILEILNC